ncbi:histidine phosphatase family protein [Kingella negevensis]|uniref:histidine phosphatase family protein n=1 Tax=Kingella negevensis TaxID=1522312 RepID=UPI00255136E8|nr:histidine phosphatase family protein [Kingella negevensis]MDK4684777.1 histidine phosphatase family protein [Kingella negevensis]MDK4707318.1 histidine phosphatase family protein [Kingella negevensis]MDK4710204.1 histidine phosphatase family protein [Kingella negevensis]
MKKIYLIRHAQSAANAGSSSDRVIYPNSDIPLTELGKQQAEQLADWLTEHAPNTDEIFTSPYLRTQQTSTLYLQKTQKTATVLNDLHEFNYLSFAKIQGKTFQELKSESEQYWASEDVNFKHGEDCDSFASFFNQVQTIRQYFAAKEDGVYVVFGHGFWIGVLLWQLLARDSGSLKMQKFREFEVLVHPNNTDVYLWQISEGAESIAKVRSTECSQNIDKTAFQAA